MAGHPALVIGDGQAMSWELTVWLPEGKAGPRPDYGAQSLCTRVYILTSFTGPDTQTLLSKCQQN